MAEAFDVNRVASATMEIVRSVGTMEYDIGIKIAALLAAADLLTRVVGAAATAAVIRGILEPKK